MDTNNKKIGGGLLPREKSPKDFSLAGVFGVPDITSVPMSDYFFKPKYWKNQQYLDDCTGNAVTEVSEDQENVELSEEYQFYLTKVLIEKSPTTYGANLMDAALSTVKYGSIPKATAYQYLKDPLDRNAIVSPATWSPELLLQAAYYKKGSVFTIDYPYTIFANIRLAIWAHRPELTGKIMTAIVGSLWYDEWTHAAGGIIPKVYSTPVDGHAFKICGWATKNGELHLVAQLSNGQDVGDNGLFYFPAAVVNKEFGPYGQYLLVDMPVEQAQYLHENNLSVDDNWFVVFLKQIRNLFKKQ